MQTTLSLLEKSMALQSPEGREKKYLTAYLNRGTIDKIDNLRGEVPRSRVVQRALNQYLERELSAITLASGERNNRKE